MTSLIRTALAALPLLLALPAQAQIVVNTLDGGNDGSCDAGATGPADDCSLLEALDAANADPDESSITFSVSGTIPITAQALVTETVNLDGTSAPAGAGTVIVDGSGLSGGAALRFQGSSASGSTLFGLSVGNAPAAGVEVAVGVSGVEIAFNFIGTTPAGADLGNGGDGILLAGPNNSIGAPLGGNTIGFNGGRGVEINGAGASGNVLVNNSIGTDFRGADLGNARDGVRIAGAPNNNVSSNTIGFNGDGVGILFSGATGNVVDQNTIGTSFNGDDIGNTNDGLFILDASGNTVENNTIGFNNDQGIVLVGTGTSGNEVSDNFVGTNASGADLGNANEGILVEEAPNNRVGGNTVGFNTDEIVLTGADATGNEISDNFVGTNATGADLGNGGNSGTGILVVSAPGNTVEGNTVGFNASGIALLAVGTTGNEVVGNFVGTNASGADLGNASAGIFIRDAESNTIGGAGAGNVVGHNGSFGIIMFGTDATGNEVLGNFVGTNATGADLGNDSGGIVIEAMGNTIGGTGAGEGNVVGFNGGWGVVLDAGTTDIEVLGNFVGTNASGADLGNASDGILVLDAPGNTIGGNTVGFNGRAGIFLVNTDTSGNEVSDNFVGTNASGADLGNANEGILVEEAPNNRVGGNTVGFNTDGIVLTGADATGNEISDNFVGTNVSGADLGNSVTGILVSDAPGNTIGGAGAGNVLGHNGFFGINMFSADATGNEVLGNFVGTNASGADLGNGNAGIRVVGAPGNTIGGAGAGEGNVIGFNGRDGILVDAGATDTEVLGNFVGTNASGADLGNQNDGILVLQASGNTVGGAGAGNVVGFNNRGIVLFDASGNAVVGNTVESNGNAGVVVAEGSNPATGNEILGNAVAGNGRIGIDLGNNGVTANDAGDADAGPNGLQNFPTITDIDRTASGDFEVTLALASTPSTSFTVELFGNDAVDLSGFGEGARPLGDVTLTTDGDGDGRVTLTVSGADAGAALSATATGPDGTSEFSEAAVVPAISAGFAERALTVREDAGSVELVVELTAAPGDPFEATVTLTDGDSDGLGGFTSAPVAASPAGSATRFAVVVPVTDNDTAETDAEYTFELRVQSSGVDVDRSETTLTVLDDDNTPVAVTIPADGLTALAVPVGGLAASDLAAAAGADSVYAVDGTRLVALDASDALRAGQIVVVEAAGPLELSGSAAPDAVAFSGVPVADLSRALVPVGNPTDGLVALSDLGVEGGTLADVVLVFDGGAFRPISLEGLDDGTDGRTDGSGSASGSTDAVLSAFGVAILQVVPDGDAADVSVTLDAAASGADGVALSELAFAPAQGEAAVVVALTADGDGSVGDVVALRFQLGADALGDGTLGPFDGLDVSAPEADGFGGTLAALGGPGADGSALAFAALTAGDLEAGPVTVPLVVSVPVPGDYALALAAPAGDVGPRAVEIEVVDGTTGTTLDVETPYAFSVADGEDVAGRFSIQVSLGAAVSTDKGVAERSLSVWPNPTSGRVSVSVALVEAGDVRVSVYDALGREVAVLHDGPAAAGASRYEVAAGWMAPGAYVVRAVSGGAVLARALTVVR